MLFPATIEEKLGFNTIRELLRKECQSAAGQRLVDDIVFSADFSHIFELLSETEEFRHLMIFSTGLPSLRIASIDKEIDFLKVSGSFLETDTIVALRDSLLSALDLLAFFRKQDKDTCPRISKRVKQLTLDRSIVKQIDSWIDEKGRIRDNASPLLASVRSLLNSKRNEVNRKLDKIFLQVKKEGWTEEGMEPTIRNGRMVIPLTATHKRKVKGFIHDESSTGHTVFLEPEDIFNTNNHIRELELEERREIIKILILIADFLRPLIPEIEETFEFLAWLDFLQAKASFAIRTGCCLPLLEKKPGIEWYHAIHPLLFLSHQTQRKEVVPLNIKLDGTNRILIISGPNAGGKSVCLKTTGLLQYMLQSGLLIPVKEGSTSGIFDHVFIDIGDEQSLENDLSTYTSHLLYMQYFLDHADEHTLFLIDEFGSGTEPQLGGAIAETILAELNDKQAMGVVTTHYTNLKLMSGKHNGIINGAMTFDRAKMEPLFRLETGKPGSSFAFEIASKIGFSEKILTKAANLAGRAQFDFDQQLRDLEEERKQIENKGAQFRMADDLMSATIEKYERLSQEVEQSRKKILEKARQEAERILADSNRLVEKTIREIKENQADKEKTRIVRQELETEKAKIEAAVQQEVKIAAVVPTAVTQQKKTSLPKKTENPVPIITIKPGSWVKMKGQSALGVVESVKGKTVVVNFGSLTLKCTLDKLVKATTEEIQKLISKPGQSKYGNIIHDLNQRAASFTSTLDLRGKRAEEALSELQHYIDEAMLLEVFEVRILHGKGDGILREMVRRFLSNISEVKSFRDEMLELGGHGITVVTMR